MFPWGYLRAGRSFPSVDEARCTMRRPKLPISPGRTVAMTPTTAQDFVGELRRTQLIEDAQLNPLRADVPKFDSARAFATHLVANNTITRFQAEKVLVGSGEELHLGPFVLLEQIARGDTCVVMKAFQPRLARTVAIKMIRPDVLRLLPDAARRLDREALAT